MATIEAADGARIHYRVSGRADGEPLVLIMGLGWDMTGGQLLMPQPWCHRLPRLPRHLARGPQPSGALGGGVILARYALPVRQGSDRAPRSDRRGDATPNCFQGRPCGSAPPARGGPTLEQPAAASPRPGPHPGDTRRQGSSHPRQQWTADRPPHTWGPASYPPWRGARVRHRRAGGTPPAPARLARRTSRGAAPGDGLTSALLEGDDREYQVTRPGRVVEEAVPLGQDVIDVG